VGTPLYLAPEIIRSEKYDHKADIWGLGCVCYQLAALEHPFEGKNIIHLGQNIVGAQPKPLLNYSAALNAFVMDMLEKNPLKRPSATELLKRYFQNRPLDLPVVE
jgi:NIMA (never in mitosis gene a)-related kinase